MIIRFELISCTFIAVLAIIDCHKSERFINFIIGIVFKPIMDTFHIIASIAFNSISLHVQATTPMFNEFANTVSMPGN